MPASSYVHRQGHAFHVILLSDVWQHVLPAERPRALRKLLGLLRAGGRLALSLRHGPDEAERGAHPVSLDEVERLARAHGAIVERVVELLDQQAGPACRGRAWCYDFRTTAPGALPLLRHIILNDAKNSTYKLGLLRTLCRAADGSAEVTPGKICWK